jgi:hypothetical protein
MSKYRRAARIDANQTEICEALAMIPNLTIQKGMKTYWYEIKTSEKAKVKESQIKLRDTWTGHYKIVWSARMILEDIGICRKQ